MKNSITIIAAFFILNACAQEDINLENSELKMNTYNPLSPEEQKVILQKGTEYPFTGEYTANKKEGTYLCRQCNAPLYHSSAKFESNCGWPSFDDEIEGAVLRIPDADGSRTEIVCSSCKGHLGHVFEGEGFTSKNTRHCVNSVSMRFIPAVITKKPEKAVLAAGCFWGVEYYLSRADGVIMTTVGYTGGKTSNPDYEEVCSHGTGHAEAVEVFFDPAVISYEKLLKLFFEIHDFTQVNRQGPDVGDQYRSAIYYFSDEQKTVAEGIIENLKAKGYKVATSLEPAVVFWEGEGYHQDYYDKKGGIPYCHSRKSIFN